MRLTLAAVLVHLFPLWRAVEIVDFEYLRDEANGEGYEFTTDLLFEVGVRTKSQCGVSCASHSLCVSFTFSPLTSKCRGHSVPITSLIGSSHAQMSKRTKMYTLKDKDDCLCSPCQNEATCLDGFQSYTCKCAAGYSGKDCETDIDECSSNPCPNGGNCTDGLNYYSCSCKDGYSGDNCQTDIDECSPNPCLNGGACTDGLNSYSCSCTAGYSGDNCQTDIDDCSPNPCLNGGACTDGLNSYSCSCTAGYSGDNCQTDIDDCSPNPCLNGGACTDGLNSYSCSCTAGYSGDNCQTDIDDCSPNPCLNGGACTDGLNSYSCSCTEGYSADNCQTVDCPSDQGFYYYSKAHFCYKVFVQKTNGWDDAVKRCEDQGMKLVIMKTDGQIADVRQRLLDVDEFHKPDGIDYFIGASLPRDWWDDYSRSSSDYRKFFWLDGTPVVTNMWHKDQPNGEGEYHVLALYYPSYEIYDRPSTRQYRYICQKW